MSFEDKLNIIEKIFDLKAYTIVAKECMGLIEETLRVLFTKNLTQVSETDRLKLMKAEFETGKGQRGIERFTMGELVGVFHRSRFIEAWARVSGRKMDSINLIKLQELTELRNRFVHRGREATKWEAELLMNYLKVVLETFEIVNIDEYAKSEPSDVSEKKQRITDNAMDFKNRYLSDFAAETNQLPWASVDPDYADPKRGENLELADIYTALDTTELMKMESEDEVRNYLSRKNEIRRVSAQEMINTHSRLIIIGDPGSGKSTLISYLGYIMANAGTSEYSDEWIDKLKKTGPWNHKVLLPIRVILRDFAAWLENKNEVSGSLLSYLENSLEIRGLIDFWPELHKGLLDSDTPYLILLDGLDEVPISVRPTVANIIDEFAMKYSKHRYVMTCRIYAYIGQSYQLHGFRQATLTPFDKKQIKFFISSWYDNLRQRGILTKNDAEDLSIQLKKAAIKDDLVGLAERPILMTVMALLHTFRGGLPEDRVELYRWAVDLLLRRWEGRIIGEKGLLETLAIPGLKMNDLEAGLFDVAFHTHTCYDRTVGIADIREGTLRERLVPYLDDDWNKAGHFIKYVRERSGLLLRHKPDAYCFPHLTFQEFMAACHLVGMKDYPAEAGKLINSDFDRWHNVFILAAAYAARTHRMGQAISSINALCPLGINEFGSLDSISFHHVIVAGEALIEIGLVGVRRDVSGRAVLNRIRDWLVAAVQADDVLEPKMRAASGNILARLGDTRFDPNNWCLPVDDLSGFNEIPGGPCLIGSDKKRDSNAFERELPQHEVELSKYYMARYPVTVAQFGVFVDNSGYGASGPWNTGFDNHPVVNVSWYDAIEYCRWLTKQLKEKGIQVRLPTEAEWAKAARGTDGRIFPWGDEPNPNNANLSETGIGTTSPVGCFPRGASPYGIWEMSGNVWEWCQDWYGDYENHPVADPSGPLYGENKVLRGGGWIGDSRRCRSAIRYYLDPEGYDSYIGFRLAASLNMAGGNISGLG